LITGFHFPVSPPTGFDVVSADDDGNDRRIVFIVSFVTGSSGQGTQTTEGHFNFTPGPQG
jgi:hypothetical protein